jgi:hypothetical protein
LGVDIGNSLPLTIVNRFSLHIVYALVVLLQVCHRLTTELASVDPALGVQEIPIITVQEMLWHRVFSSFAVCVALLVLAQFLLAVGDMAADTERFGLIPNCKVSQPAVKGVRDQPDPVTQRLVPHVQLLGGLPHPQGPVGRVSKLRSNSMQRQIDRFKPGEGDCFDLLPHRKILSLLFCMILHVHHQGIFPAQQKVIFITYYKDRISGI